MTEEIRKGLLEFCNRKEPFLTHNHMYATDLSDGTAVLTLKNLPASVLTGSDSSKALAVTCSIKMDTILLGDISTSAKMSIWVER